MSCCTSCHSLLTFQFPSGSRNSLISSYHFLLGLPIALNVLYIELSSGFHSAAFTIHLSPGVRGSSSASVPRSSFARVRRVLVTHMEEEGEEQENEKEDEREDGQQRESRKESRGESEQSQHERMRMGWSEVRNTPCSWANVNVTLKKCAMKHEKMSHVRCAFLLAVNDLTTTH